MGIQENNEFIKVFNSLDKILKQKYSREFVAGQLGVTYYIKDMKSNSAASRLVPEWYDDLGRLKELRGKRNALFHGDYGLDAEIFDENDIKYLLDFKSRVLSGNDPLAKLYRVNNKSEFNNEDEYNGFGFSDVIAFIIKFLLVCGILYYLYDIIKFILKQP